MNDLRTIYIEQSWSNCIFVINNINHSSLSSFYYALAPIYYLLPSPTPYSLLFTLHLTNALQLHPLRPLPRSGYNRLLPPAAQVQVDAFIGK